MTPAEAIRALAAGDTAASASLLPACRAEAYGTEAFNPAAVAALFARHPAPLSRLPDVIAAPGGIAVFDADADGREQAWFADLHGTCVGRLWRVGDGTIDVAEPQPRLAFAADPYLSQLRQPVAFRTEDHAELAPDARAPLLNAVGAAAANPGGGAPCRIAVLRAVSAGDRTAALLVCLDGTSRLAILTLRHAGPNVTHGRIAWDAMWAGPAQLHSI